MAEGYQRKLSSFIRPCRMNSRSNLPQQGRSGVTKFPRLRGSRKQPAKVSNSGTMFEVRENNGELAVFVSGKELEILDAGNEYILAECSLDDLIAESVEPLPPDLQIQIRSENGFGTDFFEELILSHDTDGVSLAFRWHMPNKYWEGQYGLATLLATIRDQIEHHDNWRVRAIELEDDWKGLTLERIIAIGYPLHKSIQSAATDLNSVVHSAEVSLSVLAWKESYSTDKDYFFRALIQY